MKRSINTLQHLDDLLNNPAVQALADQSSINSLKTFIATLKDWALWIERLSKASWRSPEVIVKHLVEGNVLPGWMNDLVVQGQTLYTQLQIYFENLTHPTDPRHRETLQRLKQHLTQFKEADGVDTKFTILMNMLTDDQTLALIEQYVPSALQGFLKCMPCYSALNLKRGHKKKVKPILPGCVKQY